MLIPIRKKVSALIPIMWMLAFSLANKNVNAKKVLINPLKKKKNNSGNRSTVTLSVINTIVKIICIKSGIFL